MILAPKAGHRARERQRFKRIQAAEALAPGEITWKKEKQLCRGNNPCAWLKKNNYQAPLNPGIKLKVCPHLKYQPSCRSSCLF